MFFFVKVWVVCLIWFVFCVVCLLKKWKYIIWVFLGNHGFSISISSSLFLFDFFFSHSKHQNWPNKTKTDCSQFGSAFLPYKSMLVSSMAKPISLVWCKNCFQNRQTRIDYTPGMKMGEPRLLLKVEAGLGREEEEGKTKKKERKNQKSGMREERAIRVVNGLATD